ncbi:scinderin like a [Cottoperca gobio]|uniref:Scinderin like a n=1 Tax=Cottoperca gobio TaxID=56716 RepID=A0A6J2PIF2_COTGO|nr:adseverin-like [Cottoperca gobio]
MAQHKEFMNAGKKPGLQVWRIEKMDLAPVPTAFFGQFYSGDSYILLNTTSAPSYNVHSWFGSKASLDEKGAAAIFMIQMDDFLGGAPTQFTEFQDKESDTFLSYFNGITYKEGGVSSGFKHVVTNEANDRRLLHIKGRRNIRATEEPMSWASFNKGDCFIIVLGEDIYSWVGSECNRYERLKTTKLAIGIRDNERNGRGEIEIIDEGSEPEAVIKALGPKPDLPSSNLSDTDHDEREKNVASLYLISDATGCMKSTLVAAKTPFKKDMLSLSECYILDNGGNNKIFVWKGPDANKDERRAAMSVANKFIKDKNYSQNTQVQIMAAKGETTLFKHFFDDWYNQVEEILFDASQLHCNISMAAQHGMVDDGSGEVQIWRVEKGDKKPVEPSNYGQFFGGDCYLVLYSYKDGSEEKHILYIWQGLKCSRDELGASAILATKLTDSMGRAATKVRVTQGHEPPHLVSMFKAKPLVIYLGGTSRSSEESKPGTKRLFHIRQSSTKATRAVEVEPTASSLNTNDVFVLKTPDSLFLWKGKGATSEEIDAADYVTKLLEGTITVVEETKEPNGFWKALGGKNEYQTSPSLERTDRLPRLFGCSNKSGRLILEEVLGAFTQSDLLPDDVMILDTWNQIFVWVGKDANETEKAGSLKIAEDYLKSDPSGRSGLPISTIKQEDEPLSFTGWFHAWDSKLWEAKKWN